MNTIKQIAYRLAQLCRERKFIEAYHELYSDEYISSKTVGFPTVIWRLKQFLAKANIHEINVSSPLFAGNYFAIDFRVDFSTVLQGRKCLEEICIYHVYAGKITWQPRFMD
jgi:hypothetical protein